MGRKVQLATTQPPELVELVDLAVSLGFAKNRTALVEEALREYFKELLLAIELRLKAEEKVKEFREGTPLPAYVSYQLLGELLKEEAPRLGSPSEFLEKISKILDTNPEELEKFREKLKEVI